MRLAVAFATAIAIFLVACAGEEEEGVPGSTGDMSAEDILDRVVDTASSLRSIQEERSTTSITHELPSFIDIPEGVTPEGEIDFPQESTSRTLRILVGEDSYTREIPELPEEYCDQAEEVCVDVPGFWNEELLFRGKSYFRNQDTGEWVDDEGCYSGGTWSVCSGATQFIEAVPLELGDCPEAEHWFGSEVFPGISDLAVYAYYAFDFDSVQESKRLNDEMSDGVNLVHIKGTLRRDYPDPYDIPDELAAIYEECGVELPTPDPWFEKMRDWIPDRDEGEFEMWIDQDFHIRRLTYETRMYNGDRVIQTERGEATYSLFDEAELPGPLPD